jgi:hypothetical protein
MRITNKLNLPAPLVAAITNDPYDNGDTLSATTLLKPAQARRIQRDHADELEEDAADRIWALMGQLGHSIIERAAGDLDPKEWITERRWYGEHFDERLSAAADLIHVPSATVYDWKFTSVWAALDAMKGGKSDWRYQLSMLAMLAREGRYMVKVQDAFGLPTWNVVDGPPIEIKRGKIVAVLRDWSKNKALQNPDWPQQQVASIDMDIMSDDETRAWVEQKVELHRWAMNGGDAPCTDEERWHRPGKWAVTKVGNAKATKLADTELELSAWIGMNRAKVGNNFKIEQRAGSFARCEQYCAAAAFCPQHQATQGETVGDE